MKIPPIDILEAHFKMSFPDIISLLHIGKEISLNELSKRSGVHRQTISNLAKKMHLPTRSVKDATRLTKNKGENHFLYGRTKYNCDMLNNASTRMKNKNPSKNKMAVIKRAKTISATFKKSPYPQENAFKKILNANSVKFKFQYPIDRFVIDFFIPEQNLAIEIDSTGKWGKLRREKAKERDSILLRAYKIRTLRINKLLLRDTDAIVNILYGYNVILNK